MAKKTWYPPFNDTEGADNKNYSLFEGSRLCPTHVRVKWGKAQIRWTDFSPFPRGFFFEGPVLDVNILLSYKES